MSSTSFLSMEPPQSGDFSQAHLPDFGRVRNRAISGGTTFDPEAPLTFFFWRHVPEAVSTLAPFVEAVGAAPGSSKIQCLAETCELSGDERRTLQAHFATYINTASWGEASVITADQFYRNSGLQFEVNGDLTVHFELAQLLRSVREASGKEIVYQFVDVAAEDPEWSSVEEFLAQKKKLTELVCGPLRNWESRANVAQTLLGTSSEVLSAYALANNRREDKVSEEINQNLLVPAEFPTLIFTGSIHRPLFHKSYKGVQPQAVYLIHDEEMRLMLPERYVHDSVAGTYQNERVNKLQYGGKLSREELRDYVLFDVLRSTFGSFKEMKETKVDPVFQGIAAQEFIASKIVAQVAPGERERIFQQTVEAVQGEGDLDKSLYAVSWEKVFFSYLGQTYLSDQDNFSAQILFSRVVERVGKLSGAPT